MLISSDKRDLKKKKEKAQLSSSILSLYSDFMSSKTLLQEESSP